MPGADQRRSRQEHAKRANSPRREPSHWWFATQPDLSMLRSLRSSPLREVLQEYSMHVGKRVGSRRGYGSAMGVRRSVGCAGWHDPLGSERGFDGREVVEVGVIVHHDDW